MLQVYSVAFPVNINRCIKACAGEDYLAFSIACSGESGKYVFRLVRRLGGCGFEGETREESIFHFAIHFLAPYRLEEYGFSAVFRVIRTFHYFSTVALFPNVGCFSFNVLFGEVHARAFSGDSNIVLRSIDIVENICRTW